MRKVVLLMHMSLDGFAAGPNGEMNWIVYNDDLENYVHTLHNTTDAAIYGRVTYQMMEGYWPTVLNDPAAGESALGHAQWLDKATKIIVSKSLDSIDWQPNMIIHDNIADEISKIKQQPGKDLWLIGSISVAQEFMRHGLIDEYWLNVSPVVLGSGKSLFGGLDQQLNLKLIDAKVFKGGVTALRYEPAG